MKSFVAYFVLLITVSQYEAAPSLEKSREQVYTYHDIPVTWHHAMLTCDLEGGILASPIDRSHRDYLQRVAHANGRPIFMGISAQFSKGDFMSIEGVPLSKTPMEWAPNGPDNLNNNEDCLIMYPNGTMADKRCDSHYPYLCVKSKTEMNDEEKSEDKMCNADKNYPSDYSYVASPRGCYKFHSKPETWKRAYKTCAAEGAYLALVDRLPDTFYEIMYVKGVFVGVIDFDQRGMWMTIHGETLTGANGLNFRSANAISDKYCGCLDRGLIECSCETKLPFLCQRNPVGF